MLGTHACCARPTHSHTQTHTHTSTDLQVRHLCALRACECSCLPFTGKMRMTTRNPLDELISRRGTSARPSSATGSNAVGQRDPHCRQLHLRVSSLYRGLGFRVQDLGCTTALAACTTLTVQHTKHTSCTALAADAVARSIYPRLFTPLLRRIIPCLPHGCVGLIVTLSGKPRSISRK